MRPLDDVDRDLTAELAADGRLSVNALADAVGVSRANAYRRLERLREEGVIRGFSVRLDHAALGRPLAAVLLISIRQADWRAIQQRLLEIEEVDYLAATSGDFDFLALLRTADAAELRDVVLERVHAIPGVVGTRTTFVLDEEVRRPF